MDIPTTLSLASLHSMLYNPRRLEAVGYSLPVVVMQWLVADSKDVFLLCPQLPIYISYNDVNLNPDETMPDSKARGVYVDIALLLPRARLQSRPEAPLSTVFQVAHEMGHFSLHQELDIFSMEVPVLEERKRSPTRHPKGLDEHVESIRVALRAAETQVAIQSTILFASPRFANQNKVILLATSGMYYRLAVLHRGHGLSRSVPSTLDITKMLDSLNKTELADDIGGNLGNELVQIGMAPKEREELRLREEAAARSAAIKLLTKAGDEGGKARGNTKKILPNLQGHAQEISSIIVDAGYPPYSVETIERYQAVHRKIWSDERCNKFRHYHYPQFFEPEPKPHETLDTLAARRNPKRSRELVFTGVIQIGSPVSEKFVLMIQNYLRDLAQTEIERREPSPT